MNKDLHKLQKLNPCENGNEQTKMQYIHPLSLLYKIYDDKNNINLTAMELINEFAKKHIDGDEQSV